MICRSKSYDTKPLDQVLKKYFARTNSGMVNANGYKCLQRMVYWNFSWTHNNTIDGLAAFNLKLIPRNQLKTFNMVWLTDRQRIPNPGGSVTEIFVFKSVVMLLQIKVWQTNIFFSLFPHHFWEVPLYFWQAWGG